MQLPLIAIVIVVLANSAVALAAEPTWHPSPSRPRGWWQTIVPTPVPRDAHLVRLECVSPEIVEVEVASSEPFPVRNALLELHVGSVVTSISRYVDGSDLRSVIFSLPREELANLSADDEAAVRYDPSNGDDTWLLQPIDPATVQNCDAG